MVRQGHFHISLSYKLLSNCNITWKQIQSRVIAQTDPLLFRVMDLLDADKIEKLRSIFTNMEYSKTFDNDALLKEWIKSKNDDLGTLIGQKRIKLESNEEVIEFCNPMTGDKLSNLRIYKGGSDKLRIHLENVYKEARKPGTSLTNYERSRIIYGIARNVQKNQRLLALAESVSTGRHIAATTNSDLPNLIRCLYHCASLGNNTEDLKDTSHDVKVIVATDSPSPIFAQSWAILPLLAKGIKIIFYATVETTLSTLVFADICKQSGLGEFDLNVVVTSKTSLVDVLRDIPFPVDVVCQTDDIRINEIRHLNIEHLRIFPNKRPTAIVTDTADILSAVEGCLMLAYNANGTRQGCRIFAQESIFSKFEKELTEKFKSLRIGVWNDKNADFSSCMTNADYVDELLNIVRETEDEGAQIVRLEKTSPVYLISGVQPASAIVQKQTKGVVILLIPFRSIKEAIALTNSSPGTEVASVWSERLTVATEIAKAINAKTVWINTQNHYDKLHDTSLLSSPKMKLTKNEVTDTQKTYEISTIGNSGLDETYKLYYGGGQKRPLSSTSYVVKNPKGVHVGLAPKGGKKDARNAVEAALAAFNGWKKKPGHNKSQIIYYMAENLQKRKEDLANLIVKLTGQSKSSADEEIENCLRDLFQLAGLCDKSNGTLMDVPVTGFCLSVNEPLGVIAIATQSDSNILRSFLTPTIAAIAAGNTVVAIPSAKYPLAALAFYQILDTSDTPPGVINIISGDANELCKCLYQHHDVGGFWSDFEFKSGVDTNEVAWHFSNPKLTDYEANATYRKLIWMPSGDSFGN